jgi:hypothetical protein
MRKRGIVTKIKAAALALAVSGSFIVPAQLATATSAHAMGVKLIIKPNQKKREQGCNFGPTHLSDGDTITLNPGTKDQTTLQCTDGRFHVAA